MSELVKYAFLLSGLGLFVVAGVGVFWRKAAVLASIPAFLLVASASLDRIESFKASFPSSIEAKTRELNQTVDDAKEAIRQIRELAVVTSEALINLRVDSSALLTFLAGRDEFREQDEFKYNVLAALRKMGLPLKTMQEVGRSDRNAVIRFYTNAAWRFGRNILPTNKWQDFDKEYTKLLTAQAPEPLSPNQSQDLLRRFNIEIGDFSEYMDDFRYYVDKGEQRRPEVWARRATWGFGQLSEKSN